MAKESVAVQAANIIKDARSGKFSPVYLLMGEESFYPDMVCNAIIENALQPEERDFNQTIYYGLDTDAGTVASDARKYPIMAERQLVVIKEAQNMKSLEQLSQYCEDPMDSTVLVIALHGAAVDKRKALYKNVTKKGVVLDSPLLRDYELSRWISGYFSERGLSITPDAAELMGESTGNDLARIAVETDKMLKNLPEGVKSIAAADIEKNVGISRQYSIFELTKCLSLKNQSKSLKIAAYIGANPKFAMPMAVSALFSHFYKILKYEALLLSNPRPSQEEKIRVLAVNPYFIRDYDTAVANYPIAKTMAIVDLLEEYDFKGKGGFAGAASPAELLMELISRILAC